MDADALFLLLRALSDAGVAYKVVGGVAVNLQGHPRMTEDLAIVVRPDADNVRRLRGALSAVFDDPSIAEITAEDLQGDYPAIQYIPPGGGFRVDTLARLGEAFDDDRVRVETRDVEGVPVPVATREMLIEMKRDTVRLRDRLDVEVLSALSGSGGD